MRKLIPFFLIIFLVGVLFAPYFFPPSGKMIYGGDIYDAYYYWKGYLRDSLLAGIIPFWNPYNFSGTPFLAHPNINIFYPLNWIFILFPLTQSFSIYMFLHMVIAGITMYWLGRQYTDRYGALFCGISYSLGSYFSARLYAGHPEYMDTAAWIPLVFGLTRRAILKQTRKNIIFAILSFVLLFISGNELFVLFALEILGLYLIFLFLSNKLKNVSFLIKNLGLLFFILAISLGIAGIEVLPRIEFLRSSLRSEGIPLEVASSGSLTFTLLKLFINPFYYGSPQNYNGPWPNLSEYVYYVGILPLLLIIFFLFLFIFRKGRLSGDIWFFLIIVIPLFLLISLGSNSPINIHEILWKYVPFYTSYRFPVRHLFAVFFSLSLVSGIILGHIKYRFVKIIFIIVLLIDLFRVDSHFFRLTDIPTKTFDQKLIETISSGVDLYRVLPDFTVISPVRRDLDFGASNMYGIQSTSDYNSMILSNYYRFVDLSNQASFPSTQYFNVEIPPPLPLSPYIDFLNVKYLISDKSADPLVGETFGFKLLSEGERYRFYENKTYLPRFFSVNQAIVYPSYETMVNAIRDRKYDLSKTILFAQDDMRDLQQFDLTCSSENVKEVLVHSYTSNKIRLSTDSQCGSFLSSSEVYYPGWMATIDGKLVPVYRSNYAFRSIYIPRGVHRVEFYYFPRIYIFGFTISVLSAIGLFIFARKK